MDVFRDVMLGHALNKMDAYYIQLKDKDLQEPMNKYSDWLTVEIDEAEYKLKNSDHNSDQGEGGVHAKP